MTDTTQGGQGRRADIQFLRFVAVIVVVAFHSGIRPVRAGFVGVDIFFVISGYLILGLLTREGKGTGRISLANFWARRVRRLLPASVLVLLVTAAMSVGALGQFDMERSALDIAAAALYAANIRFAVISENYFAVTRVSPVLHFWSLGVEEQFYVLAPLIVILVLMLTRRKRKWLELWMFAVLAIITEVSWLYLLKLSEQESTWAFYGTWARGWEFGVGGLAAMFTAIRPAPSNALVKLLTFVSYGCILVGPWLIPAGIFYPNPTTAIVVVPTAFALWAGSNPQAIIRPLRWFLSLRPFQALGDWSYSLYLWHWPILVFGTVVLGYSTLAPEKMSITHVLALDAYAIVLSWLTYRCVETPVRFSPTLTRSSGLTYAFAASSALTVTLVGVMVANYVVKPIPAAAASGKLDQQPLVEKVKTYNEAALDEAIASMAPKVRESGEPQPSRQQLSAPGLAQPSEATGCFSYKTQSVDVNRPCTYGPKTAKQRWVLFGDSYANSWLSAAIYGVETGSHFVELHTRGTCSPILMPSILPGGTHNVKCDKWRLQVLDRLRNDPPDVLIMTSSRQFGLEDGVTKPPAVPPAVYVKGVKDLIKALPDTTVVWIRYTPVMAEDSINCLTSKPVDTCRMFAVDAVVPPAYDVDLFKGAKNVYVADLTKAFCSDTLCPMVRDGTIIYRDFGHISGLYGQRLGPLFSRVVYLALTKDKRPSPQPSPVESGR